MRPISLRNAFHCPPIRILRVRVAGKRAPDRSRRHQPGVKSVEQTPGRKGVAGQRGVADRQPARPAEGDPTRVCRAISRRPCGFEFASAEQVGDVGPCERSGDEISGQCSRLCRRQVGIGMKRKNATTVGKIGCVPPAARLRSSGAKPQSVAADAMRPPTNQAVGSVAAMAQRARQRRGPAAGVDNKPRSNGKLSISTRESQKPVVVIAERPDELGGRNEGGTAVVGAPSQPVVETVPIEAPAVAIRVTDGVAPCRRVSSPEALRPMAGPMALSGEIFPQAHIPEKASRCARQGFADPLHLAPLRVRVSLIDEQGRVEWRQHKGDRSPSRPRPDNGDVSSRFEAGRQVEPSAIGGER
jgi:hypothetical protein